VASSRTRTSQRDRQLAERAYKLRAAETSGDGLTLSGYAAVFDRPTRIDSWEGCFDEQIARGAFRKTIAERKPVLMYNHGRNAAIGDIPIGSITTLREDARGLCVEARLFDNDLVKPVRDAIAGGAIDGMSFRFEPIIEEWDESGPVPMRTIRELACPELGPVNFAAYTDTSVGVRSEDRDVVVVVTDDDDDDDCCVDCPSCGAECADDANFCATCGAIMPSSTATPDPAASMAPGRSAGDPEDAPATATRPTTPHLTRAQFALTLEQYR